VKERNSVPLLMVGGGLKVWKTQWICHREWYRCSFEESVMSTSSSSGGGGIGFVGLLTILFIGLKLTGHIQWSWLWVLSPIWITLAIVVVLLLMAVAVAVIANK